MLKTADSYSLGKDIFVICHNKEFNVSFAHFLYCHNKMAILTGYLNAAFCQLDNGRFFEILGQANAKYHEAEYCFRLLETRRIDDIFFEHLITIDQELQESYWTNTVTTWFDVPNFAKYRDEYVMQLAKHGNFRQFTLLLEDLPLKLKTYVTILVTILNNNRINNIMAYDIIKIFEKIYTFNIIANDDRKHIAKLEMYCIDAFDGSKYYGGTEPRYLLGRLKTDAAFCADLLLYVNRKKFTDEEGKLLSEQEKQNFGLMSWRVLENVKFCPCEEEGQIDECKLGQWCSNFITIMDEAGLVAEGRYAMGKFLANCPVHDDNETWPVQPVCNMIEQYYDTDLEEGFCDTLITNRGCYTDTQGEGRNSLSTKI